MRLFIGIEFPERMIAALTGIQGRIRQNSSRGRFRRGENFHLTLKFLGEVPPAAVPALSAALAAVGAAARPFALALGRLGQFGTGSPIRVVWMDVAGDTVSLQALQRQVEEAAARLGFPAERRPWRPHITLGQDVVLLPGAPPWGAYELERLPVGVAEFALILSEEIDRRRVYTPIGHFHLGADAQESFPRDAKY